MATHVTHFPNKMHIPTANAGVPVESRQTGPKKNRCQAVIPGHVTRDHTARNHHG